MKKIFLLLIISICLISCTENQRTKQFGGEMEINLPPNTKLVNVTFKESDIWYLTRPMHNTDIPESYTFKEESSFGVWEGTIIINESK